MLIGAMLPAAAGAADYPVPPASGQAFANALAQAQAHPGPDRILLGAGYYTAPVTTGFNYDDPGNPVEIVGAGRDGAGATVITGQLNGSGHTLFLVGGVGTSIHDVRVDPPINAALGTFGLTTDGVARHVSVMAKEAQQTNSVIGVLLRGGTLEDAIVDVGTKDTTGVLMGDEGGTMRDSTVSAKTAVSAPQGGALIERSRLAATLYGAIAYRNQTTIRSSEVALSDPTGTGIAAFSGPGDDNAVVVDGTTIVSPGGPKGKGIWVDNVNAPAAHVEVTVKNSLIRGFGFPMRVTGTPALVHIGVSYSDYPAGSTGTGSITESNISDVGDTGFAGPGDYHLVKGSPLVDAGDPAAAQGLDLAANPLVADGNDDGIARRDIGAYELPGPPASPSGQPAPGGGGQGADTTAPVLSGFASARKSFAKRTRFRFTLTEAAHVTIRIQRAIGTGSRTRYRTVAVVSRTGVSGPNRTAFSRKVGRRLLRPGRYRAVARATDFAGNRSASRRAAFRIARYGPDGTWTARGTPISTPARADPTR